jgi:hypothetical protein
MVIGIVMMGRPEVTGRLGSLGPIQAGRSFARGPRSASVSFATGVSTTASMDGGAAGWEELAGGFVDMLVKRLC